MKLPNDYEKIKKLSGIYCIKNTINNRVYIGSACNFMRRWSAHKRYLETNRHDNQFLQNDFNKLGSDAFEFLLLEIVLEKNQLIDKEKKYLDEYFDNQTNCYNICLVGNSRLGTTHTDQTKEKISRFWKGKLKSEEHRKKISLAHTGKKHSAEHKKNYGNSRAKTYDIKLKSPTGEIFGPIFNLREFCRTHCLNQADIWCLINKKRYTQVKGWVLLHS